MNKSIRYKVIKTICRLTLFASCLLAACNGRATTIPNSVVSGTKPEAIETYITASPTPFNTHTPIPTATSTSTPEPTSTPAPINLEQIVAQITGVGENGNMLCISSYEGDPSVLGSLDLAATIKRDGVAVESNIPAKQVAGKDYPCFELVDARYVQVDQDGVLSPIPGNLSATLSATSPDGRQVTNSTQASELGTYSQAPFLSWLLSDGLACISPFLAHKPDNYDDSHMSYDFIPITDATNPSVIGTDVTVPGGPSAKIVAFVPEYNGTYVFSPTTGFEIAIGHASDLGSYKGHVVTMDSIVGQSFNTGELILDIGNKDAYSEVPHIHVNVIRIPDGTDISAMDRDEASQFQYNMISQRGYLLDFVSANLFLDPQVNEMIRNASRYPACGNVVWEVTPTPNPALNVTIDGYVGANEWPGQPVLQDPAGDSLLGSTLDLTELYMIRDDTYLYLMLRAGSKPATDWTVFVSLDNDPTKDKCNGAETALAFDYREPNAFILEKLTDCDIMDTPDRSLNEGNNYLFRWGDVIEVRIPLAYLNSPQSITPTKVETYGDGQMNPDIMP